MNRSNRWDLVHTTLGLTLALTLSGCATSSGGGGGGDGGNADPLPDFQLGDDAQFDADVAAITQADNDALACLDEDRRFSDKDTLLALKKGYTAGETSGSTFPEFVAETVTLEQNKSDDICNTTLGNASEELLGLIQELTDIRNRGAECAGEEPTLSNENSLAFLKTQYLGQAARTFPTLLEFADAYIPAAEQVADDQCAE
ncbi:MAG: hypothetical protein GY778_10365 [bacterium]|nr:hypothetical protein [bacterium]